VRAVGHANTCDRLADRDIGGSETGRKIEVQIATFRADMPNRESDASGHRIVVTSGCPLGGVLQLAQCLFRLPEHRWMLRRTHDGWPERGP